MWPYSETEAGWLALGDGERGHRAEDGITPEAIEYYVRRGRQMRAQAAADLVRRAAAALGRVLGGESRRDPHMDGRPRLRPGISG